MVWEPPPSPKPRAILWQKCAPGHCEFLDVFGPNQYIQSKKPLLVHQKCYGSQCDQLEEYGPNRMRAEEIRAATERCRGKECQQLKKYVNDNFLKNLHYLRQQNSIP